MFQCVAFLSQRLKTDIKIDIIYHGVSMRSSLLVLFFIANFFSLAQAHTLEELDGYVNEARELNKHKDSISYADPYEQFNRDMYAFNMAFHKHIGRPIVTGYQYIPTPIRSSIHNVLDNIGEPISFTNSFLQGNIEDGLEGVMRFAMNTTFGILGLFDVAKEAGLYSKNEDFGQTLQVWGFWKESNFLVLPFLGPTTTRNFAGNIVDSANDPAHRYILDTPADEKAQWSLAQGLQAYVDAAPLIEAMQAQADPYIFMRDSYIQYRNNRIYNGNVPLKPVDDFIFE